MLPDAAFQVAKKLASATLDATITVNDYVTGDTSDIAVNLNWTATGPLVREKSSSYTHSPGCKINTHWNGTHRDAIASGSITDGMTDFASLPLVFANIGTDKAGQIVIGCGG